MTADLMPFSYGDHQVRTVVIDGEPWFVLADLCAILGLDASAVRRRLDGGVTRNHPIFDAMGRAQIATIVSEPGMYEVVIRSDKPVAIKLRRWITHEVLPTIRRTGSYGAPALPDITTAEGVLAMAEQFAATARALVAEQAKVAELAPRAEVADRLLDASGDLSVADAAKSLARAGIDIGATRMFDALARMEWIYRSRSDGRWRVYQSAIAYGYMAVIPQSHHHPRTGELVMDAPQPRVTPKGLQRMLRELTPSWDLQPA